MSSTAVFAAGIFATESGQRLLHILMSLGERGFRGLYDRCAKDLSSDYYQTGLRRVHAWSDDVLCEDIENVKQECPDMDETFEACFFQYVADRYRGRKRPTVQCPETLDFVRRFLESFGQHETLATGDYFFKRDPVLKRLTCMDAARQALFALMTVEHVRVELASEAGSVRSASRDLRGLTDTTPPELMGSEVTPDDSVSQIGSQMVGTQTAPEENELASEDNHRGASPPSSPPPKSVASVKYANSHVSAARSSVVSRHDFAVEQEAYETPPPPPPHPTPPKAPTYSAFDRSQSVAKQPPNKSVASSRDSRVSIGQKNVRSPR